MLPLCQQSSASLGSEWDLSESSLSSLSLRRSSERLSDTPGSLPPPSLEVRTPAPPYPRAGMQAPLPGPAGEGRAELKAKQGPWRGVSWPRCCSPAAPSAVPATLWCTTRRSWPAGHLTTPTSTPPAPSAPAPSCPCSACRPSTPGPGAGQGGAGRGALQAQQGGLMLAVTHSVPSPQPAPTGASGTEDAPVPGGPGPVLSDRRLCLALDEPQLCNGHVGVRGRLRDLRRGSRPCRARTEGLDEMGVWVVLESGVVPVKPWRDGPLE